MCKWLRLYVGVPALIALDSSVAQAGVTTFTPTFTSIVTAQAGGINTNSPLDSQSNNTGAALTARSDYAYPDPLLGSSSAGSFSSAQAGALHVSAGANASVNAPAFTQYGASGNARAVAAYSDRFIVHSLNQLDGKRGTMTVAIGIDGTLNGGGDGLPIGGGSTGGWSGTSWWQVSAQISSTNNEAGYGGAYQIFGNNLSANQAGSSETGPNTFGNQYLTFDFIFGSSIYINLKAETSATSRVNNNFFSASSYGSSFTADLSHTVSWGGITEMRDANGTLIRNFNALSDATSYNYAEAYLAPVPLPPSIWLFGTTLLGFLGLKSRRN